MLSKLLLTIFLTSQLFLPATQESGQILGVASQSAGDEVLVEGPAKIINKSLGVRISAEYGVVIDKESNKILFNQNAHQPYSIASLTKLMTALVFLASQPDLQQEIKIQPEDITGAGKMNLLLDEKVKLENLLYLSLIASDNNATLVMVRSTGLSEDEFVAEMNSQAKDLGLSQTHFIDPVGFSKENVSTPYELAQILKAASQQALIKKILGLENYSFISLSGRYHQVKNTNKLLNSYLNVLAGKTGFTQDAGYCLASLIKLKNGHEIIAVVLAAPRADDRFDDTKRMVGWVGENYEW